MGYTVHAVLIGEELKECPQCGYADGFHSMFKGAGDKVKWLLICPSCHAVFDPGLIATPKGPNS